MRVIQLVSNYCNQIIINHLITFELISFFSCLSIFIILLIYVLSVYTIHFLSLFTNLIRSAFVSVSNRLCRVVNKRKLGSKNFCMMESVRDPADFDTSSNSLDPYLSYQNKRGREFGLILLKNGRSTFWTGALKVKSIVNVRQGTNPTIAPSILLLYRTGVISYSDTVNHLKG